MRSKPILILGLLMGSCSEPSGYSVDPVLEPIMHEWQADVTDRGLRPEVLLAGLKSVAVDDLGPGKTGASSRLSQKVWIDRARLHDGFYSTKATLYHELGHWAFRLPHGSCELMGPANRSEEYYRARWSDLKREYLNTIFLHGKIPSNDVDTR